MQQRPGQSNAEYIRLLEETRRKLAGHGHIVPAAELAHKILDTLNPANDQHARYFDFDPRTTTLQQVKDFLYKVDRKERMRARVRRGMQGSSHRNGGNRANRGYNTGRKGQGDPGKRPFVKRITAGRYRQIKRRRDEDRSQRSNPRKYQRGSCANPTRNRPVEEIVCYECGEPGHTRPECPQNRKKPRRQLKPVASTYEVLREELHAEEESAEEAADAKEPDVSSGDESWSSLPSDVDDDDTVELQVACVQVTKATQLSSEDPMETDPDMPDLVSSSEDEDTESDSDDHTDPGDFFKDDEDDDMPEGAITFDDEGNVTADLDKIVEWDTQQSDRVICQEIARLTAFSCMSTFADTLQDGAPAPNGDPALVKCLIKVARCSGRCHQTPANG